MKNFLLLALPYAAKLAGGMPTPEDVYELHLTVTQCTAGDVSSRFPPRKLHHHHYHHHGDSTMYQKGSGSQYTGTCDATEKPGYVFLNSDTCGKWFALFHYRRGPPRKSKCFFFFFLVWKSHWAKRYIEVSLFLIWIMAAIYSQALLTSWTVVKYNLRCCIFIFSPLASCLNNWLTKIFSLQQTSQAPAVASKGCSVTNSRISTASTLITPTCVNPLLHPQ